MKGKRTFRIMAIVTLFIWVVSGCHSQKEQERISLASPQDWAAERGDTQLCVGACLTPEQGKALLSRIASTYHDKDSWEKHARKVREGFIRNSGFDKIPEEYWKRPFNAVIRHTRTMDGYIVENIAIDGMPGHLITGNLYRPISSCEKAPAILSPHGHWYAPDDYGRFRPDVQYRCAALARMGAIVFAYDMIGFGENITMRHDDSLVLRYQTFNSKRVLDYLCSREDVDTSRIGVTGASGGGTQTIYISLIDPRIKVSVPVVMVSSYFFGGCICESGLPVTKGPDYRTNLADMAAVFAPKPLLIISDGHDWTRFVPETEYPYIKKVYKHYDAGKNVQNVHFPDEGHSYGINKRKGMYPFMAEHLGLDYKKILNDKGEVDESFVTLLPIKDLKVFPEKPIAFVTHCCSYVEYSPDSPLYDTIKNR